MYGVMVQTAQVRTAHANRPHPACCSTVRSFPILRSAMYFTYSGIG